MTLYGIVECHILCKQKLMAVMMHLRKFHDVRDVARHQLEPEPEERVSLGALSVQVKLLIDAVTVVILGNQIEDKEKDIN